MASRTLAPWLEHHRSVVSVHTNRQLLMFMLTKDDCEVKGRGVGRYAGFCRGRSSISTPRYRGVLATYPMPRRAASMASVWSCSGRGLPSKAGHPAFWWSLTPPFHPYPCGRSILCGTVSRVTPGGCYPPSCSVEPGRSSAPFGDATAWPTLSLLNRSD